MDPHFGRPFVIATLIDTYSASQQFDKNEMPNEKITKILTAIRYYCNDNGIDFYECLLEAGSLYKESMEKKNNESGNS